MGKIFLYIKLIQLLGYSASPRCWENVIQKNILALMIFLKLFSEKKLDLYF